MGMTLYSCITPIAQMSRKHYYLRAKASGYVATRVSLVNIRLLPFSASDNIKFLRYGFT